MIINLLPSECDKGMQYHSYAFFNDSRVSNMHPIRFHIIYKDETTQDRMRYRSSKLSTTTQEQITLPESAWGQHS